jgi:hypothetical protein
VNAKKAHPLADHIVTKETFRMTLLSRFVHRISPDSSAATTPARGDDSATRSAGSATSTKKSHVVSGQTPISDRLELRPSRTAPVKDAPERGASKQSQSDSSCAASEARSVVRAMERSYGSVRERIALARTPRWAVLGATFLGLLVPAAGAASAQAATLQPWWHLDTSVRPAVLPPGGEGSVVARASNLGNETTSGPSEISLELPAGLELVEEGGVPQVSFLAFSRGRALGDSNLAPKRCSFSGPLITCQTEPSDPAAAYAAYITAKLAEFGIPDEPPYREEFEGAEEFTRQHFEEEEDYVKPLAPYEYIEIRVKVKATSAEPGPFTATASGGGSAAASRQEAVRISGSPPAFGTEHYDLLPEEEDGSIDARAGSHPYQLTTTFALNQNAEETFADNSKGFVHPPALARNLHFRLPPGQIGNATVVPRCSASDFTALASQRVNLCPPDTAIGVANVTIDEPNALGLASYPVPLWNLQPAFGEPARFGFEIFGTPVILDTAVRSGKAGTPDGDYGVTVSTANTSQLVNLLAATVTFWGTPGDPIHDNSRGWSCLTGGKLAELAGGEIVTGPCKPEEQKSPAAFLTLPTNCAAPFATTV